MLCSTDNLSAMFKTIVVLLVAVTVTAQGKYKEYVNGKYYPDNFYMLITLSNLLMIYEYHFSM